MTLLALLRDVAARIVAAQEALEAGDTGEAHSILRDLEVDVISSLAALALEEA